MSNGYFFPLAGGSGGGGTGGDSSIAWKPNVDADGNLSWARSNSTTTPATQNIKGEDGKSAYDIWIEAGNTGSEADFIEFLKGENGDPGAEGKSAYELWLELGNTGSEEDFLESLKGDPGDEGFSPVITENADNTDEVYKLDIETKDGQFTTPNLKGSGIAGYAHYVKIKGTIGDSYYATSLDYSDLNSVLATGTPVTGLYGGWTIDSVESSETNVNELAKFEYLNDKKLTSVSDTSVDGYYGTSLSISYSSDSGSEYELLFEWNDFKPQSTKTYSSLAEFSIAKNISLGDVYNNDYTSTIVGNLASNEEIVLINGTIQLVGKKLEYSKVIISKMDGESSIIAFLKSGEILANYSNSGNYFYGWISSYTTPDTSLDEASTNTVENKVITEKFTEIENVITDIKTIYSPYPAIPEGYGVDSLEKIIDAMKVGQALIFPTSDLFNMNGVFPLNENGEDDKEGILFIVKSEDYMKHYIRWTRLDNSMIAIPNLTYNGLDGWTIYRSNPEVTLDDTLDTTSENAIKNKVVAEKFEEIDEILAQGGNAGADGKSAYDIWIDEGNAGSEADFLAFLKGEKGDPGEDAEVPEILHTDLSGNLAGITTVLDLVNALLTEYRATSPKKPIRFVSGEITKTTLTDLPVTYGVLQITVAGWDVVEVRLAHSANGFKTMYYGFMNRISGQELISSITWQAVATTADHNLKTYTNITQLGLTSPCSVIDIYKVMPINSQLIYASYGSETHAGGYITDAPATHGLLEIKRSDYDGCRTTMTFTESATNSMGYKRKWVSEFASSPTGLTPDKIKWHEIAYKDEVGTITTLAELGLTSSVTVDDVHNTLVVGQIAILPVRAFDNYQTLFPYADINDQYARVEIQKGESVAHSRIFWFRKDGSKFAIGDIDSNNKLRGWCEYALKSYVDSKIADLQAQIDALKS